MLPCRNKNIIINGKRADKNMNLKHIFSFRMNDLKIRNWEAESISFY